jgi:SAM-dependent methyltransferase
LVDVGGGYDKGYSACPLFWPDRPGSLLAALEHQGELRGGRALDVGCGEGTNAAWLTARGYLVEGIEVSDLALGHAESRYPNLGIRWIQADARSAEPTLDKHDLVVAYGLLHCVPESDLDAVLSRLKGWTTDGGLLVIVTFNDRSQDLSRAHAGFNPTLRSHESYLQALEGWDLLTASDSDLHESHPDTNIPHHHSMTRIIARSPGGR